MSVAGKFTVAESDDNRFVVGTEHDVRLYSDRSFDIDCQQAKAVVPEPASEPVADPPAPQG